MKIKIFAFFILTALMFSVVALISADNKRAKRNNELAALLPASEIVVALDSQRLFNQALPQILSANPEKLAEIHAKIDAIKDKTGLDVREFQQIAVGLSSKQASPTDTDFEPFILARGNFSAGALIAVSKMASNGKYREEKIGDRTVYVFTAKEIAEQNKPKTDNSFFNKIIDKMIKGLSREVAVTAYDNNTLALGTLERMREAFEKKTRVSSEVLGLVNRNPNGIVVFGGKMPNGLSRFLPVDNDELGKNLDSIHQMSGVLDVGNNRATLSIAAKTLKNEQAQGLKETLDGLQMVVPALLGGSKGADKKVYARMIENAKISRSGNEVLFNLQVPQSDIDVLVGKK